MHFGMHLMIDGYGGSPVRLDDETIVRRLLTELPLRAGMHPLIEPTIIHAPDNQLRDPGGWSGFVIIAESHISLHTFPLRRFVSADIYTCTPEIDVPLFETSFRNAFELQDLEINLLRRGLKYPESNIGE